MSIRRKQTPPAEAPQLIWPGKHLPTAVAAGSPRLIEIFAPLIGDATQIDLAACNTLFWGDNLTALAYLRDHGYLGRIKLIYIDPPYDSGVQFQRKIRLRGPKTRTMKTSADQVVGAQPQFTDQWGAYEYLQFIYERLPLLRELLAEEGSLWLHCDQRQVHHLRVLLQEIFGPDNYLNTVVWRSQVARGAKVNAFYFPASLHYLLIFAKNRQAPPTWHTPKKQIVLTTAEAAREFMRDQQGFFRTSDPGAYTFTSLKALHAAGRLYAPYGGSVVIDETLQQVYPSNGGNLAVKYYLKQLRADHWAVERAVDNLWDDIPGLGTTPGEDLGYPTQKTAALLKRIIQTATDPGDWVLDCFMGSGTTLAVAQELGRRWIGCDNNRGALITTRRRIQSLLPETPCAIYHFMAEQVADQPPQPTLQATVRIARNNPSAATIKTALTEHVMNNVVTVEIVTVNSPMIGDLLRRAERYAAHNATEWQTLVDCVAIDPGYDGVVFRPVLVDAPQKKSSQVRGLYQVVASAAPTTVAVRITDLLGAEVIVTAVV